MRYRSGVVASQVHSFCTHNDDSNNTFQCKLFNCCAMQIIYPHAKLTYYSITVKPVNQDT